MLHGLLRTEHYPKDVRSGLVLELAISPPISADAPLGRRQKKHVIRAFSDPGVLNGKHPGPPQFEQLSKENLALKFRLPKLLTLLLIDMVLGWGKSKCPSSCPFRLWRLARDYASVLVCAAVADSCIADQTSGRMGMAAGRTVAFSAGQGAC
jgi:hypothetical protein